MAFIQPCFIRKNTPELRKKLEELGYRPEPNGYGVWFIHMDDLDYLVTFPEIHSYMGTNRYWYKTDFDCGTNEELFLALAALRDDTGANQWFTDGEIWVNLLDGYQHVPLVKYIQLKGHKATVEEIIEHFKK